MRLCFLSRIRFSFLPIFFFASRFSLSLFTPPPSPFCFALFGKKKSARNPPEKKRGGGERLSRQMQPGCVYAMALALTVSSTIFMTFEFFNKLYAQPLWET